MTRETTYPDLCKKRSWLDSWLCLLNYFVISFYDAKAFDDPRDNLSWRMTKRSWLDFWLRLAWTWLHELPVCLPCMNYSRWAILTLNGDLPILEFPVLFMGNERRVLVAFPSCGQPILATHIYTLSYRLQHLARAQFFLFFTSLPPGSWEGSVVESIHQLSYLG